MSIERPALYVVATPIGNRADISARAVAILGSVDRILAEDTRHSRRLLDACGVTTPLGACHDHNEKQLAPALIARLLADGAAYALISDAGTPLIADPGYALVQEAVARNVPVLSVPGPCALTAALSIGGLPTDRFVFEGFLPAQPAARARRLAALADEPRTLAFYEAPHRLSQSLGAMIEAFGPDRDAVVARELTKRFETVYRGTLAGLARQVADDANAARGELVVLVAGAPAGPADDAEVRRVLAAALAETDRRAAVRIAAALTGRRPNEVYRLGLDDGADGGVEKDDANSHTP